MTELKHVRVLGTRLTVSLALLILVVITASSVFAASDYDYTDSTVTLHGRTRRQYGCTSNNCYRHEGQTHGQTYGGGALAYLRVQVHSYDDNESKLCNMRNVDSGNVYGVFSVVRQTSYQSVLTCQGAVFHEYHGLSIHWFASSSSVTTDDNW